MAFWSNNGIIEKYCNILEEGFVKGRISKFDLPEKISKKELEEYYNIHNRNDTCEHFNISVRQLLRLCEYYDYRKQGRTNGINTRSHESYIEGGKKSSQTQKENWNKKTDEEKKDWGIKQSIAHSTHSFSELKSQQMKEYNKILNDDEKNRRNELRSQSMKKWWASLSEEEKYRYINKKFDSGAGYQTSNSKPNNEFAKLLEENNIEFEREFRLSKYSYDFKIGNILIEINPTITHNIIWSPFGNPINEKYHYEKSLCAENNGYRCIHVFDWEDKNKVISLLKFDKKIYARNCEIKEIDEKVVCEFLEKYHLQGSCKGQKICIGLFFEDELIQIMTFGKPRYNKNYEYELLRLCTKDNYIIVGGANRLFKYFVNNYSPKSIISYCDRSKFCGDVYKNLGFSLIKNNSPSKHWCHKKTKEHITNNLLRQRGFDQLFGANFGKGTSNEELMIEYGFLPIYDCGQNTYTIIF